MDSLTGLFRSREPVARSSGISNGYAGRRVPTGIAASQLLALRDRYDQLLRDASPIAPPRPYCRAVILEIESLLSSDADHVMEAGS